MKKIKGYFILFAIIISALVLITLFKTEVTGMAFLDTGKGPSHNYYLLLSVLALSAIALTAIMTTRTAHHDSHYLDKSSRHEMKQLRKVRDYVNMQRERGYSDNEIRDALIDYEWDSHMVDHAIGEAVIDGRK